MYNEDELISKKQLIDTLKQIITDIENERPAFIPRTCFECGSTELIWENDYSYEDCGLDGEGIVHFYHCNKCRAEYEVRTAIEEAEDGE